MLTEHRRFIESELMGIIPNGAFFPCTLKIIEIFSNRALVALGDIDNEISFSSAPSFTKVSAIYVLLCHGLNFNFSTISKGEFIEGGGSVEAANFLPKYSAQEQMAIYGLYTLDRCKKECCTLAAYRALVYALKLKRGDKPTDEETKQAAAFDFAEFGKLGGQAKDTLRMMPLRKFALSLYHEKKRKNPNRAATELTEKIIQHGKSIGINLLGDSPRTTIYKWFLDNPPPDSEISV